jgi:hypothetical protein
MALSQATGQPDEKIRESEIQLRQLSDSINRGSSDPVREAALAAFNPVFFDLLSNPETYNYPFDSLKAVSKLASPDGKLRIFTWLAVSRQEGTCRQFGVLQRKNPVSGKITTIGLLELNIPTEEAEKAELKSNSWAGALYYDVIERKIQKRTCYFVLGWKGNDRLSTKKVIDVITFDEWDNVAFGLPVFTDGKTTKYRVIFEFNAQAVMLLRYDKKKKMIVFDHLSPSSPSLKGQYRHYGPDFTYDGYQFKKGNWNYKSNLDLRNPGERK